MVFDPETLELDFDDDSLTANMRCAYPLDYISNASATALGGHPKNIVMLTCDAFGVLPPIARLTPAQAMYHFLSGFTSKVAGTERGVTEPEPTFSTCFGAPFMPRRPEVYGKLLRAQDRQARRDLLAGQHRLDRRRLWHRASGCRSRRRGRCCPRRWTARWPRPSSARIRTSASRCRWRCKGVDRHRCSTRAGPGPMPPPMTGRPRKLVEMFSTNFAQYEAHIDDDIRAAAIG